MEPSNGSTGSTILGRRDVAVLPCIFGALVSALTLGRTTLDGGSGIFRDVVLVGSVAWLVGSLALTWAITRPGARDLRSTPEFYALLITLGGIALSTAIVYDGGLRSPYVIALVLGPVFFGIALPTRLSMTAAGAVAATVLLIQLRAPDPDLTVFAKVAMLVPIAWWTGAIGHRAHENAAGAALKLSRVDRLTESLNRRGLLEAFHHELRSATDRDETVAVLLFDLDDFKPVNDRLGHAAGDELLHWVGAQVARVAGPFDQFGRLGGDEFALVMPAATAEHGRAMASLVTDAVRARIGVSVGVASSPADGGTPEALLRVADGRMYEAKGGRERRVAR